MDKWAENFRRYGFAGAVAGLCLYVIVFDVRAAQTTIHEDHSRLRESVADVVNISGQTDMAMQKILAVLLASCVNSARTENDRNRCLGNIDIRTR